MDKFPLDLEFLNEYDIKYDSWFELWTDLNYKTIDPCQAAADHYLLFGVINDSFVDIPVKTFPSPQEIKAAGLVLKRSKPEISQRTKDILAQSKIDPTTKLSTLKKKASELNLELIEKLDGSFRQYLHLACGGELRHMLPLLSEEFYPVERRNAWGAWYYIFEKYGLEALQLMEQFFLQYGEGDLGGELWANAASILCQREAEELGPDPFSNKQIFVDRVFTLEHNNGCILSKLPWINKRLSRPGASESIMEMKWTVLQAHCSNPVDILTLHKRASVKVQNLLVNYFEIVEESGFTINGVWANNEPTELQPTPTQSTPQSTLHSTASKFDWSDFDPTIFDSDILYDILPQETISYPSPSTPPEYTFKPKPTKLSMEDFKMYLPSDKYPMNQSPFLASKELDIKITDLTTNIISDAIFHGISKESGQANMNLIDEFKVKNLEYLAPENCIQFDSILGKFRLTIHQPEMYSIEIIASFLSNIKTSSMSALVSAKSSLFAIFPKQGVSVTTLDSDYKILGTNHVTKDMLSTVNNYVDYVMRLTCDQYIVVFKDQKFYIKSDALMFTPEVIAIGSYILEKSGVLS